jgi:hypothetical protein
MVISAVALLEQSLQPDENETREALAPNSPWPTHDIDRLLASAARCPCRHTDGSRSTRAFGRTPLFEILDWDQSF